MLNGSIDLGCNVEAVHCHQTNPRMQKELGLRRASREVMDFVKRSTQRFSLMRRLIGDPLPDLHQHLEMLQHFAGLLRAVKPVELNTFRTWVMRISRFWSLSRPSCCGATAEGWLWRTS